MFEKFNKIIYTENMNIYEETKMIMNKYGLNFKKKFGQNFLINETILDEMIEFANISKEDIVLEIGPGIGTLTSKLLEKAGEVISIEIDKELLKPLEDRFFLYKNFTLISADIMEIDLTKQLNKILFNKNIDISKTKLKVVANIPYYITTPIILKLLAEQKYISQIYIMVQKEVAERLKPTSKGKEISSLTYYTQYFTEYLGEIEVNKSNFLPIPKVDSQIIGFEIRKEPYPKVDNEKMYFRIVKSAFLHRRKTFLNSLKLTGQFNIQIIKEILQELKIDERIRPEKLTNIDYANICNMYIKRNK